MLAKTHKKIKRIAFFGDAEAKENDQHFLDAFNTAKLLAEKKYIIVNGGGPGVMFSHGSGNMVQTLLEITFKCERDNRNICGE